MNEEQILEFWKEKDIFHKSIKNRSNSPYFSFYDGPPFATGKPHYGHILATTIKDTVLRYWTMKGYQVPRRVGWDCHGLPVENLIEKELEIKNKKQIEEIGVEKFNEHCRNSVFNSANITNNLTCFFIIYYFHFII
jgi:isoleucyl-tRNA synthetase